MGEGGGGHECDDISKFKNLIIMFLSKALFFPFLRLLSPDISEIEFFTS